MNNTNGPQRLPNFPTPHLQFTPLPPDAHTPWDDFEDIEEVEDFTMQSVTR